MGRAPCCDKANVKKGPWSPEEDAKLKEYIEKFGTGGNWIALPQKVGTFLSSLSFLIWSSSFFFLSVFSASFFFSCFPCLYGFCVVIMWELCLLFRTQKMWEKLQTEMAQLSQTQH